jgi:microcystin-dependent protein
MPATNNFLQFNPAKNNMLSDADFNAATLRQQGIQSGIRTAAASNLHNKMYYQVTTMASALGSMLANKGYTVSDADISALTSQLSVIMTAADMTSYSTIAYMQAYVASLLIPPGSIIMWTLDSPPTGFLECDGSSLLRASYGNLYSNIGIRFGNVDGVHFNLPDLRGYFIRGWDHGAGRDPDKAARANRGDGTVGDYIGTQQGAQMESHLHPATASCTIDMTDNGGVPKNRILGGVVNNQTPITVPVSISILAAGGSEDRPININLMFIIKY